jgi:spoIIIJ-associated protein
MSDDTEVTARADDADEGILDGLDTSGDETVEVIGEDITDENGASGARRSIGSRVRLLEREGEVAADFLERLLDIADLDGDIEVDIDGDRASVAIVDSEDGRVPRRLVGSEGKVLDALQELTRLAVQAETGERSRLMLDIAGHREQRRTVVLEIARTAIAEVTTTGSPKSLDDMSAFERKIVHDEVAAAGLGSESEGVEPHRHIVVFPA